ncbi:prepilin-type N-terminal cleavage/methylation domain-containing protein [Rhodoferax sp.]|uniref:prepilin-type N-terminal cleavage/methylation domain-containing protein n=1 Tax=Rhodoferax sp. TaxID=50421 RepID=UPI0025E09B3F|nr:prepilin-type N-terminal cleavage/methylation domain-containing protein [Rhodoferax sp.]
MHFKPTYKRSISTQRGFTLVELMVSLILGLILISGVLSVFISNRDNYKVSENIARIQENSRTAYDLISRDIREAGETPCGSKLMANLIRSGGTIPWWADWNSGTIRGFAGGTDTTGIVGFGTTTNARVNGTEALLIMQASDNETNITSHDTGTYDMVLNSVTGLNEDDIVVACDLQSAAIFQIDSPTQSSKSINYDPFFSTLNCGNGLAYPTTTACASTTLKSFDTTSAQVAKLKTSFWYIGVGSNGKNSLYRTRISKKNGQVSFDKDEVVSNVGTLIIRYLTKDISTDTLNTSWVAADDAIFSIANGEWSENNTNQVVAVRLSIALLSEDAISSTNTNIVKTLTYVISLRNRDTLFQVTP